MFHDYFSKCYPGQQHPNHPLGANAVIVTGRIFLQTFCIILLVVIFLCIFSWMLLVKPMEVSYSVDCINNTSHILISKVRVVSCKSEKLTIPKLELASLLSGTRPASYLSSLLVFCSAYIKCDGLVALAWVQSRRDLNKVTFLNVLVKPVT